MNSQNNLIWRENGYNGCEKANKTNKQTNKQSKTKTKTESKLSLRYQIKIPKTIICGKSKQKQSRGG